MPWQRSIIAADLVIFDHYNHADVQVEDEVREIQVKKLRWLLDYTDDYGERYVVWFGGHSDIVRDNPDRIYAANSRFALHARIREMLEFLKYMTAKKSETQH